MEGVMTGRDMLVFVDLAHTLQSNVTPHYWIGFVRGPNYPS